MKRLKSTGEILTGSPLRVLSTSHPFHEYHFIDEDASRIETLRAEVQKLSVDFPGRTTNVHIHLGDAIELLVKLIPTIAYRDFKRALLFLDPYGLDVPWSVIELAAKQGTIDVLLNFSIMDLNRNYLPAKRETLTDEQREKVLPFLGPGWEEEIYPESSQTSLFGKEFEKLSNNEIVLFYANRLESKAGFKFASEPLLFEYHGANLYYLLLASHKEAARKIMNSLVKKYGKT